MTDRIEQMYKEAKEYLAKQKKLTAKQSSQQTQPDTTGADLSVKEKEISELQAKLDECNELLEEFDKALFQIAEKNIKLSSKIAGSSHYLKDKAYHEIQEKCERVDSLTTCMNHKVEVSDNANESIYFCCDSENFLVSSLDLNDNVEIDIISASLG